MPPMQVAALKGNTTTYPEFLMTRERDNNSQVFNTETGGRGRGRGSRGRVVAPP